MGQWEGGVGTLLGLLLRGYTTRLSEEDRRKRLQAESQRLQYPLPPIEESSYLSRVLRPRDDVLRPYTLQETILANFEEDARKRALEAAKQREITERGTTLQTQSDIAAGERVQAQQAGGMARVQAQQAGAMARQLTPQAILPVQERSLEAAIRRSDAAARLNNLAAQNEEAFRLYGDAAPGQTTTPPAPGQPASGPGLPGTAPAAKQPVTGAWIPKTITTRAGPISRTYERPVSQADLDRLTQETTARELGKPPGERESNAIAGMETADQLVGALIATAHAQPEILGFGREGARTATSYLPHAAQPGMPEAIKQTPETAAFYSKRNIVVQSLRDAITGAQASFAELKIFYGMVGDLNVSDPDVFEAQLSALRDYTVNVVRRRMQLRRTPRGQLDLSNQPPATTLPLSDDAEMERFRRKYSTP